MALTAFISINATARQDVWPDGTTIDKWFDNREKVDVNTLGKRYVVTECGVKNDSTTVQTEALQAVIDRAMRAGLDAYCELFAAPGSSAATSAFSRSQASGCST